MNSSVKIDIMLKFYNKTKSLQPPPNGVPAVTINGNYPGASLLNSICSE